MRPPRLRRTGRLLGKGLLGRGLQRLGQHAFDQVGEHLAQTRVDDAVAQIGEAVDDRHAGAQHLVEVKAERDQFAPPHGATAE
jgi:hypothetical protein